MDSAPLPTSQGETVCPERDSLAFVTLLWRAMSTDFRLKLNEKDRAGRSVSASEAPIEIVSSYLQTPRWEKWIGVLDRTSDVELAMLVHIANHNVEEVKERQRWMWLIASLLLGGALAFKDKLGLLDALELSDLLALVSPIMIVALYFLSARMKAGELESCVKLAGARRQAGGGTAGSIDAGALAASLSRFPHGMLMMGAVVMLAALMVAGALWVLAGPS
jgi:hypothetical protein